MKFPQIILGFILLYSSNLIAQNSFTWVTNDTIVFTLVGDDYAVLKMEQSNDLEDTLFLGIEVIENSIPDLWDGMLCIYGKCLASFPVAGTFETMWPILANEKGYVRLTLSGQKSQLDGRYRVRVYDLNNEQNSDTATWVLNSVIDTLNSVSDFEDNLSIYPNPSKGMIFIDNSSNMESVEIFDLLGRRNKYFPNLNSTSLTTSLDKGMYFISIELESGIVISRRIVVNE
ncbi:MAG: T9SS type A sorting domain-containing protein [Crocinitomicaceae bacterium]